MHVLLATPRGFCAGVDRAIDIVALALDVFGPPVYVRHEIVHNRHVVERLRKRGAVFVEELSEVPEGSVLVFSAHGVAPSVRREAVERRLRTIDATCPLVTKVHSEAVRFAREGYAIVLVGHRGHPEVDGTMGEVPGRITLVEDADDVARLDVPNAQRVAYLTQTTLSVDETRGVIDALKERFPSARGPAKDDICYATSNRQLAVKALAERADVVLVVGSDTSSNSNRLREVAESLGARAYLVEEAAGIDPAWLAGAEVVGVTAGASAPEDLVEQVVAWLRAQGAESVEDLVVVSEDVYFALPPELLREIAARGVSSPALDKHMARPATARRIEETRRALEGQA
jgi:4-hydroxy-3-methylbut-2-enyl diphosphate reductase